MRLLLPTLAVALPCLAALPARAVTCDELVASITERIRANGVADPVVTAVDATASAPGKPVGTCDMGRKKIMYVRGTGTAAATAAPPAGASAAVPRARVVTECADGRIVQDGPCRKK